MGDLGHNTRISPALEKRQIEIALMKDKLVYDKIELQKREALIKAESFDVQLEEIEHRMEMKRKQIAFVEGKLNG